jgi:hypothetical protein
MEPGMSAQACAAAQRAQLQLQAHGWLEAHDMEDTISSSIRKSSGVMARCSTIWTIVSNRKIGENLMPKPLPSAPNVGEENLRPGGGTHPP